MDITKVLKAEPNRIASPLERSNQGIFIPAYQRAYAWDAEDVGRLLEDAAQGISQLLDSRKSLRFSAASSARAPPVPTPTAPNG